MDKSFAALMELLRVLAEKEERNKEESVTYHELLRYSAALARLNLKLVNDEINRRDERELYGPESGGHSTSLT